MKKSARVHIYVTMVEAFKDGSGAPAVVHTMGHAFACDYLGEVKLNCISPKGAAYRTVREAASQAKRLYMACLKDRVTLDWFTANAKLYR